jgi:hypothetical protein
MEGKTMSEEKQHHHQHHYEYEQDKELERFMAMTWGTPSSIATIFASLSLFLLSIGGFLWLLHIADIIK